MPKDLRVAVLLSGSGTTLANLLHWRERGGLYADIRLVISSRPGVRGLQVAADAGIRNEVVAAKDFHRSAREGEEIRDWDGMSRAIDRLLLPGKFDLIVMAGFLSRYIMPKQFEGRVINIHPALIPSFCGQGMYGHKVHEAVVKAGVRVTGCTVHFADNNYDTGPIILQRCCPVYSADTPDDVAGRVFREECVAYPTAINLIAEGRVHYIPNYRIHVDDDHYIERFGHDDA